MTIIFYEHEHCEKLLEKGTEKITQRDLNYLAKYWDYHNETQSQIHENLKDFCLKNDKYFNVVQGRTMIRRALSQAKNYHLRIPIPISITTSEIESIQSLKNYKYEKYLFAMLVSARFFKVHRSKKSPKKNKFDNYLYSNASMKDIKDLAGVAMTYKEWDILKHELTVSGLISPTRLGKNCWNIGFENSDSPIAIEISDYKNIISYYQEYCGEQMIVCSSCGTKTLKKSNRHKYCNNCWKEIRKEKVRLNVRRLRGNSNK